MELKSLNSKLSYSEKQLSEKDLSDIIENYWEIIFPELHLIKREFQLIGQVRDSETGGRIDFFAFNPKSQKFVIIEVKKNYNKNIRSQIFDYADFIEDNFDFIYLKAKEILPEIDVKKDTFELILFAKNFKSADYSRINKFEYSTKLITYNYFENNHIVINTHENKSPKTIIKKRDKTPLPINDDEYKIKIKETFWQFFKLAIVSRLFSNKKEFITDGAELYLRIEKTHKEFNKYLIENELPIVSINLLRKILKADETYKGFKKSLRFENQVSSSYIFNLLELNNKYEIK